MPDSDATAILPRLVTARELAAALDYPLSRVYELARDGDLPHVRLGRAMRFDPAAVRAWLDAGGTAATDGDG